METALGTLACMGKHQQRWILWWTKPWTSARMPSGCCHPSRRSLRCCPVWRERRSGWSGFLCGTLACAAPHPLPPSGQSPHLQAAPQARSSQSTGMAGVSNTRVPLAPVMKPLCIWDVQQHIPVQLTITHQDASAGGTTKPQRLNGKQIKRKGRGCKNAGGALAKGHKANKTGSSALRFAEVNLSANLRRQNPGDDS